MCKRKVRGDGQGGGTWGQLHDDYFLAEGDMEALKTMLAGKEKEYGKAVFAEKGKTLDPISDKPIPAETITALKNLPN